MVGELITLPVRVGVRVTRLWFRAVEETFSVTSSATGRVVGLLASRSPNGAAVERPQDSSEPAAARAPDTERRPDGGGRAGDSPQPEPASRPSLPTRERRTTTGSSQAPPTPLAAEPVHVSEEPELVEEFAELGAEQGAGAEVHVDPPWDGYQRMNAKQVISRLASASAAELAAVQLYENSTRRRQTIMNAAERGLRSLNGGGSRPEKRGSIDA